VKLIDRLNLAREVISTASLSRVKSRFTNCV